MSDKVISIDSNKKPLRELRDRVVNLGCGCDAMIGYCCEFHKALSDYEIALVNSLPVATGGPHAA